MGFDLTPERIHTGLLYLLAVVVSITVHEFSHALAADRLGDDTPRRQGRITLLPTEHFDPFGFLMVAILAFGGRGLGWGRPVMVNPANLRHPRRDMLLIAAAGPFSNLIIAVVSGLIIRFSGVDTSVNLTGEILKTFLFSNLSLFFFNLIPIPPLDGSKVLSNLLPLEQAINYDRVMGQFGFMILFALVFLGGPVVSEIIGRPSAMVATLITGVPWTVG